MSNLINISEAASLALHSLVLIAKNNNKRMNAKALAEILGASQAHLAKVFQKLSKAGLVKSVRGPLGGFELNKPADEIRFIEIFETIEGKTKLGKCWLERQSCPFGNCLFANKMNNINQRIYDTYATIKLSDYCE